MLTKSGNVVLTAGSFVTGKWNHNRYRVKWLLGEGANGKVYLVEKGQKQYALKIGYDAIDLQSEVNVIKTLDERIRKIDPYLIEVDDLEWNFRRYPFYVMKYVRGRQIHQFMAAKGADWFHLVGKNVLTQLVQLHEAGWQFCDLKMENVIVSDYGKTELVDYGGVTPIGNSVKQFTEIYDRGYWRCGSRIADEKYDLFSFAVMCIQLIVPKKKFQDALLIDSQERSVQRLKEMLIEDRTFTTFHSFIIQALDGKFIDSKDALLSWKRIGWKGHAAPHISKTSHAKLIKMLIVSFICFLITAVFVLQP